MKIAIIDYGMGNLASVQKACVSFGAKAEITAHPRGLEGVDKIILPGVGAFGEAMHQLERIGLAGAIKNKIREGILFLGICLGMQLLFERSQESKGVKGLGILKGKVARFQDNRIKVPHMGWNTIEIRKSKFENRNVLLKNMRDDSYVYFCHSYYVEPKDKTIVRGTTDYGVKFASLIAKDNIFGIQFHPEKSQMVGLKILENFINL